MTEPLRLSFEVGWPAEQARVGWTAGVGRWCRRDHTMSGAPERVVLQAGVGGKIYERAADGTEHEWGEVTVWQPPTRLTYLWYLGRDKTDTTEVEIRFHPQSAEQTRVDIEHRGWERAGQQGGARNQA